MRKTLAAAMFAVLAIPAAPAMADPPHWAPAHGRRAHDEARYDRNGRSDEPQPISSEDRVWRGGDGHYYCRRSNGTTGLVIGGAVGALVGRQLDGGRDHTTGTILGAAGGALLGREIDRDGMRCR